MELWGVGLRASTHCSLRECYGLLEVRGVCHLFLSPWEGVRDLWVGGSDRGLSMGPGGPLLLCLLRHWRSSSLFLSSGRTAGG